MVLSFIVYLQVFILSLCGYVTDVVCTHLNISVLVGVLCLLSSKERGFQNCYI